MKISVQLETKYSPKTPVLTCPERKGEIGTRK
jgi:hypothetical protein